jgi:hypothetical protein
MDHQTSEQVHPNIQLPILIVTQANRDSVVTSHCHALTRDIMIRLCNANFKFGLAIVLRHTMGCLTSMPCFILNAYGMPVCFSYFVKRPIFH